MIGGRLEGLRVLVADDDEDQRFVLRRLLARAGVEHVSEAANGAEAVRLAEEETPGLIVLDLAMPVRSGFDALPELRERAPDAPIVILSNFPQARYGEVTREAGAVGYVEKRTPADRLVGEILVAAAVLEQFAEHVAARLDAGTGAPGRARNVVRGMLDDVDRELLETVELLVTEVVTNAVLHAASAPRLDLDLAEARLRIEVYDDDPAPPARRDPRPDERGGRGVLLLDRLASRWGVDAHGTGKVVWFEVDRGPEDPPSVDPASRPPHE